MGVSGQNLVASGNHWGPIVSDKNIKRVWQGYQPNLFQDAAVAQWVADGEAQNERVGIRVRERSQTVIDLLPARVPYFKLDSANIPHLHVAHVILKRGGLIDLFLVLE